MTLFTEQSLILFALCATLKASKSDAQLSTLMQFIDSDLNQYENPFFEKLWALEADQILFFLHRPLYTGNPRIFVPNVAVSS